MGIANGVSVLLMSRRLQRLVRRARYSMSYATRRRIIHSISAHLSKQLYYALHELENLQKRRITGEGTPLVHLNVQGPPENRNCKTNSIDILPMVCRSRMNRTSGEHPGRRSPREPRPSSRQRIVTASRCGSPPGCSV